MRIIFGFLAAAAGIYSLLIFLRIILSWFGGLVFGKPVELLNKATDPYLDFWRKIFRFQIGFLDFSAVAAILSLSLLQGIFGMLAASNRIYLGQILAAIITSVWSLISFIIVFCVFIIILRGIAYFTRRNMYGQFWSIIDSIYQPLSYRINKIFFGSRIVNFKTAMIVSLIVLAAIMIGGSVAVNLLASLLYKFPL